ncbi:MAG: calcium/sodium antiporter [Methylomonas sp.]|nr:MAG: calcium/sodium antiporter [Methylomonas sp.]PPD26988.1 MAG: calcium/sodium antiporter [Methylomonas sp.]PPD38927.1 MAG: calcium/sodium antiporter [Methylomonas sp.]PPD42589.1 MAG: calcium/sodium antiporter [Methylomonas sp.]PPD54139.1 MAG: calcium/sodium antiporter [Methylomonas sp.]
MALPLLMIFIGLIVLIWSADLFVEGAAASASQLGMSPLLIGVIVVGFGTSAPEMTVSVLSAMQGNPGISLGNAYGSNIANIALILGITALINPISIHSQMLKKELPILLAVTLLAFEQLYDGQLSRTEALTQLAVFIGILAWMTSEDIKKGNEELVRDVETELEAIPTSLDLGIFWVVVGLTFLIVSSRVLVWGAVSIAQSLGVSDLIIGLTIVAVGTSLPELASSIMAIRKGEHDLAVGNIVGSNLFNTLAVVGLVGSIQPMPIPADIVNRDWLLMALLTLALFFMGYDRSRNGYGKINRLEGGLLLATYIGYTLYLIDTGANP